MEILMSEAALLAMMPIRLGSTAKPAAGGRCGDRRDPDQSLAVIHRLRRDGERLQCLKSMLGETVAISPFWTPQSPHLIRLLSDPDWIVRNNAMYALVPCGAKAAPAIPRLIELLGDHDPQIRASAADALALLDTNEKRSAARLRVLLQDPDRRCSSAAAKALRALGLSPEE